MYILHYFDSGQILYDNKGKKVTINETLCVNIYNGSNKPFKNIVND